MAFQTLVATVGVSPPNSTTGAPSSVKADYDAAAATFAAALAVLVADGATPTQAHVTTANNAYTALAAQYTLMTAGDVTALVNLTNVTSRNILKAALDKLLQTAAASGTVTAS